MYTRTIYEQIDFFFFRYHRVLPRIEVAMKVAEPDPFFFLVRSADKRSCSTTFRVVVGEVEDRRVTKTFFFRVVFKTLYLNVQLVN